MLFLNPSKNNKNIPTVKKLMGLGVSFSDAARLCGYSKDEAEKLEPKLDLYKTLLNAQESVRVKELAALELPTAAETNNAQDIQIFIEEEQNG